MGGGVFGIPSVVLWIAAAASVAAFVAYGVDKSAAGRGARRVPEVWLHAFALAGGWPGAFVAQRLFRHKTKKASFLIVFWMCVALHAAVVGWIALRA